MSKQYLDNLIDKKLNGDKTQVVTLFKDDSIFLELNSNANVSDWFHFEPKTFDGDYLIKDKKGYLCYYQERGIVSCEKSFDDISDAAKHFFNSVGYM